MTFRAFNRCIFIGLLVWINLVGLQAEKIGDIANIVGVRDNQLIGYGLIIGLNGTGDKTSSKFTMQSIANMLESVNVKLSPDDIKSKNVAAVMITASLPSFARQGDKIDIQISSIGDAKSIEGGVLVMTPLTAVDGNIYAIAQGSVTLGSSQSFLSGSVVDGAIVEREVSYDLYDKTGMTLSLKKSSFQNAIKIQNALNKVFSSDIARAIDSRTIKIIRPENLSMIEFLALVQEVEVSYSNRDKIVINEKSGTIVAGIGIIVHPVMVSSGDISIKITQDPLADEQVQRLDDNTTFDPKENTLSSNGKSTTIANVVKVLQKMGASPKSVISILEAMKKSGAFNAEIEVI